MALNFPKCARFKSTFKFLGSFALIFFGVGCQETKQRDVPKPVVTATQNPAINTGDTKVPTNDLGSPTVTDDFPNCDSTKFYCKKMDTTLAAACKALVPADKRCDTEPIPTELHDKIKGGTTTTKQNTTTTQTGKTCKVLAAPSLNLRSCGDTKSSCTVIASLPTGSTFAYLSENAAGWVQGKTSAGKTGWACDTCLVGGKKVNYLDCKAAGLKLIEDPDEELIDGQPNADGSHG